MVGVSHARYGDMGFELARFGRKPRANQGPFDFALQRNKRRGLHDTKPPRAGHPASQHAETLNNRIGQRDANEEPLHSVTS